MILLECYVKTECDIERNWVAIVWILWIYTCEATALDSEQVLCTDIHAQALHGELGCDSLWEVVAKLDGAQLQIASVLNPIRRHTLLIVVVRERQGWDVAVRIGCTPSIEQTLTLVQEADIKTCPNISLLLQVRDDVNTLYALEERSEVEVLVLQVDVETVCKVWNWVIDPSLVSLCDFAVAS